MICNECETVAHCTKHGCVPKQPAPVQPVACQVCGGSGFIKCDALQSREKNNGKWGRCLGCQPYATPPAAQPAPVQEPVAWPCLIAEADFSQNTVTLTMQCEDYKVSARQHWLSTTPPAQPAVPDALTSADIQENIEYVAGWNECRQAMLEMTKNRSN
jgi:hypothetical protein